ncbi:MAG: class II aldolase/adducin family protein, partial [Chloroflexota bacterium]|nr:class II aldolase/adducin family protein [Chloroflexota bacterium]
RVLAKGGILPWVFGHCSARIQGSERVYMMQHVHWAGKIIQEMTANDVYLVDVNTGIPLDCESIDVPEERFFHLSVYQARPDIGGLIYGHPNMSCAFAAAGRDTLYLWGEKVPIMKWPGFGSAADKGKMVADKMGKANAVVWDNGNVVVGKTIEEACVNAFALEWEAQRQLFLHLLGVKNPEPSLYFPNVDDRSAFATKLGFEWFEAMDPGPGKKIDGKLFWHGGL